MSRFLMPFFRFISCLSAVAIFCMLMGEGQAQKKREEKLRFLYLTDKYEQALSHMERNNYPAAETLLLEIIGQDTNYLEPLIALAHVYKQKKQYEKSMQYLEKLFQKSPNDCAECQFDYAICLAGLGRFSQALTAMNAYLALPNLHPETRSDAEKLRKNYQFAVDYYKQNKQFLDAYKFYPRNMGANINSVYSEYFPTLNFDATKIYFTRRLYHRNEDFFEASFDAEDSVWERAHPLPGNVNTELNEGTQSVSLDESWLAFTGCDFPNGLGSCDIYLSVRKGNVWDKPRNMGTRVNSEFWESQPAFSADKRSLYFAAKLPDGYGGSDIYVSYLSDDGEWSYPQNMGPTINTPGDETSPFIHADNQTLYFTSNGHPGYGGMDIYMSMRNRDGSWGNVKNLGYPINTVENENCLFITSDGKTAYYASDRADSYGGLDIYTFELRTDVRPKENYWVQLSVRDKKGRKLVPTSLKVVDMEYNAVTTHPLLNADSSYLLSLVAGKNYFIVAQKEGYFYNYEISYRNTNDTPLVRRRSIELPPLEQDANMPLKNIFFDFDQHVLRANSVPELNALREFLVVNQEIVVRLEGHTDNTGSEQHNLALSQNRARAVYEYLVKRGISPDRLTIQGFGSSKPVSTNHTEQGRALNRRTEVVIVQMHRR